MSVVARKLGTLGRVVRREGVAGIQAVLKGKVARFVRPPHDYARLAPSAVSLLARHGRPGMYIHALGAGIGDDLLCTAVFRELRRRGRDDFWVASKRPELYRRNDDVGVVVPPLSRYDTLFKRLGARVVYPWYTSYHPAFDRDDPTPQQHLIALMCQKAGITGEVALRPYLTLGDDERAGGRRVARQVAIQSAGLDATHAMRNKNWYHDRYQGVVDALRDRFDLVQVGSAGDPPLAGALDLRGRTSLRETAAVLAESLAFVGQVGLLMHMARAVDCRSVIVYGGRETPAQSGYPCNENLYSPVPCSPCWLLNACPYERMCLQMVDVGQVVEALERQVGRHGTPLACDTDTITEEQIAVNALRHAAAAEAHQRAWIVLHQ